MRRAASIVLAIAVLASLLAPSLAAVDAPSELLPYLGGASPYSGVGRYEGRATCNAFFLDTGPALTLDAAAPAYAITAGNCASLPDSNDVQIDALGTGRVIFNYFSDSGAQQLAVPVLRTAYATMKGSSIAVLELAVSFDGLDRQLIRPLRLAPAGARLVGEPIDIVGAPLTSQLGESFLRIARCRIDGIGGTVLESIWHWFDLPFNGCRDMLPGIAGAVVLSAIDGVVYGTVTSTTTGAAPSTICALGHPCEPAGVDAVSRPDTTYLTSLDGLIGCFDPGRRFNLELATCPLDRGLQPEVSPSYVGPVNPFLTSTPTGTTRRRWDVALGATVPYRFTVVTPPFGDCRTTRGYGGRTQLTTAPVIDAPLPLLEGFAFLCIAAGTSATGDVSDDGRAHPVVVVARVDTQPPQLPAQVTITEMTDAWRVLFETAGQEIAFHAYKAGRRVATNCGDGRDYRIVTNTAVLLPKASGPWRLCAIPYDAAQNPGRVLDRALP